MFPPLALLEAAPEGRGKQGTEYAGMLVVRDGAGAKKGRVSFSGRPVQSL